MPALLVRQSDEEGRDGGGERRGADIVDVLAGLGAADRRQQAPQDEQRDQPDRDVDEEDPVPADRVGDEPAETRADERRQAEDSAERAEVLAALGRCVEVRHNGECDREDGPATQTLQSAEQDELLHRPAEPGKGRAEEEQAHREDDDRAAAVEV